MVFSLDMYKEREPLASCYHSNQKYARAPWGVSHCNLEKMFRVINKEK